MLRSLLWMASACASLFFLVRLKNSDTVNSFTLGIQRTYGRRSLRGGSSLMRTAVGIYTVCSIIVMEILWAVVLIYV
jgi:hypothetical protein